MDTTNSFCTIKTPTINKQASPFPPRPCQNYPYIETVLAVRSAEVQLPLNRLKYEMHGLRRELGSRHKPATPKTVLLILQKMCLDGAEKLGKRISVQSCTSY